MAEQESDNTAVKIIAIIGGVIVVVVLTCGIVFYFGIQAMKKVASDFEGTIKEFAEDAKQGQKAVDSFLADIRTGKLDNAYQSTTKEFKERMSRKDFEDLVKQHLALKERPTASNINMNSPNPPGTPQTFPGFHEYSYKAQGKDGKDKIDFTVTLEKEDGQMKVDHFTVTKEEAGKENGQIPP